MDKFKQLTDLRHIIINTEAQIESILRDKDWFMRTLYNIYNKDVISSGSNKSTVCFEGWELDQYRYAIKKLEELEIKFTTSIKGFPETHYVIVIDW